MPTAPALSVHRTEVRTLHDDPRAGALVRDAAAAGFKVTHAAAADLFLIEAELSDEQLAAIRDRLLTDPVLQHATAGALPVAAESVVIEVHPLAGVMDPVAQSVEEAARDLLSLPAEVPIRVATGRRYDLRGISADDAAALARRLLANPVVAAIHTEPYHPESLPRGHDYALKVSSIPIRGLTDDQLAAMSREAHLFLSLDEMRAIQAEFRTLGREPTDIELETLAQTWSEHCVHKTLKSRIRYRDEVANREPRTANRDSALRTQHSALTFSGRPGCTVHPDGSVTIDNLLKSTVAAATHELIAEGVDWALSVFEDNAGIVAFDEKHAVCIKVETHNHPSAIEPYGGAATGVGGCIRDVIGTGLGAKPIANTDVFCVAMPGGWVEQADGETKRRRDQETKDPAQHSALSTRPSPLPPGTLHPRRILTEVVTGVRDYGNRMGIPTVNGAVAFDDRYVGNPLVFCGCVGVMPRDKVRGRVRAGDLIVALGGRTGRDGIHGATFSSAEMTGTHADEFGHAVQIGNAIEEKRVLDAILRARDYQRDEETKRRRNGADAIDAETSSLRSSVSPSLPLFHALTDCGAGGFSSAVGEMGKELGAEVHLESAPLKYAGLSYTEVWISEAQERMVLAVPRANLTALQRICDEEGVELAVLGTFGTPDKDLVLHYRGTEVGRLPMNFLHEGLPQPTREAVWRGSDAAKQECSDAGRGAAAPMSPPASLHRCIAAPLSDSLLALLRHPNIASKHWIIGQYDHEVQGNTLVKPLVGPAGRGPSDAAVIAPVPGSRRALAIACGLATGLDDPYQAALAGIDECVRNLVCAGADPTRIAILDNFCWPSCGKPENLGSLVRAALGCYDGAKAYRTPFVSGKDSLNNQLTYTDPATGEVRTIEIPPTLLISGMGIVPDAASAVTSDAKRAGNVLILVGRTGPELGGSHLLRLGMAPGSPHPEVDLKAGPANAHAVAALIASGLVRSAHDCSDGGLLVAIAEMLIGGSTDATPLGASIDLAGATGLPESDTAAAAFAESPSRYILEVEPGDLATAQRSLGSAPAAILGRLDRSGLLAAAGERWPVEDLAAAWRAPLDW